MTQGCDDGRTGTARARSSLSPPPHTLPQNVPGTELATWDWDLHQDILNLGDRGRSLLGHTSDSLPPLDTARWHALLHPADRTLFEHAWARHLSGQQPQLECALRLKHRDGRWVDVWMAGHVVQRDGDGVPLRAVGVLLDITQQRQHQHALALAELVFNHTHEAILVTDAEGRIVRVNPAFCRLTGYAQDDVLGRTPAILSSGRHDAAFFAAMWHALHQHGAWSGKIWNRRRDGGLMANGMTINAVPGPDGCPHGYVGVLRDITSDQLEETALRRAALYDPLTGLGNRLLLHDRMQQALARSNRQGTWLAVAMMDLDGFKAINDQHGHAAGDRLLVAIAQRLRAAVREVDTVVRLGGDEFVVLLPDLGRTEDAQPLVRRLLDAASTPIDDPAGTLQVSASIGVTYYPQVSPVDETILLQQADSAMYQAKRGGRHRCVEWQPRAAAHRETNSSGESAGANNQP
ncbi:MAG: diguanylate cyclase [Tepidimonas sp.]|uniref:sensor domain-containing diguanylate cyclase n=1 Tax=Tepidimonas sp. TaxID=2002775 RepID=UPI00259ED022|nr:sensor domain-containing diguanylate cyclase [Tepidimonas sp.]MDM7456234.1 diguanylate cyclase [Tepidimonas sp.]